MIIKLSKLLYILFIFYLGLISDIYVVIPGASFVLGSGMIFILLLSKFLSKTNNQIVLSSSFNLFVLFCFYALISGVFVATDTIHLLDSIFTYVQILGLIFFVINVSMVDKDNDFFIKSFIAFSLVYAIYMLFWGHTRVDGRLTLTFGVNPNNAARILLYGFALILLQIKTNNIKNLLFSFSISGLFIYLILETGSRKAFYGAGLLLILWLVFTFKDYWKSYNHIKKIFISIAGLTIFVFIIINFLDVFLESSTYSRLIGKGVSLTDDPIRAGMYYEAYNFFASSPFVGIGFNQFRNLSVYGTYSHSTYAELLSTTGVIGTTIYLLAYFIIIKDLFIIRFKSYSNITAVKSTVYIIIFFIMLILGTGVIHFYGIIDNIVIAITIAFIYVEKKKLKNNNVPNNRGGRYSAKVKSNN